MSVTPEQFLEQLPSAAVVRDKIQKHREEAKVLRRLLKLASEHEASTTPSAPKRESAPC